MVTIEMTQNELLTRALTVTPGASQTRSKAPGKVGPRDMREGFPLFAERGMGPYLFADGEKYLDFVGANAAVPLGYGRPEIVEAVAVAVGSGNLLSVPCALEGEVSEALCRAVGAERVRWVKTGSEAVSAAVKLARAATGASTVIVASHSYHGWHDWTCARFHEDLKPGPHALPNGVPSVLTDTILTYKYGIVDPGDAVELAHKQGKRVAAIVIEPDRFAHDQRFHLQRARAAAGAAGAVLIFDEMVFGFRWALAGAQEYYHGNGGGVRPDLSCYGKALGSGVPVACVAGKASIMDRAATLITSTYGGDRIGLAAARAVLDIYAREPVIATLWANAKAFEQEFYQTNPDRYTPSRIRGRGIHFGINWTSQDEADDVLVRCARRGVLFHRDANNASAAMTETEARFGARVLAEELAAK